MDNIIDRSEIPALVERLRGEGKTIVTFNGSFDVLHTGHMRCLQEAKALGDVLIIPLNSDASIQRYKGKDRPIVPEADRAEMLASLSYVDYVVLFDDMVPIGVISEIRPDIHCNGADWGPCCIEKDAVEKGGGRIHILQWAPGRSTSELIRRIRALQESPRAVLFAAGLAPVPDTVCEQLRENGLLVITMPEGVSPENLEGIRDKHHFALNSSWLLSTEMADVFTGRCVNAKTILIGTAPESSVLPHYEVADIDEAARLILDA